MLYAQTHRVVSFDEHPWFSMYRNKYTDMPREELLQLLRIALWETKEKDSKMAFCLRAHTLISHDRRDHARWKGVPARQFEKGKSPEPQLEWEEGPSHYFTVEPRVSYEIILESLTDVEKHVLLDRLNGASVMSLRAKYGYTTCNGKAVPLVRVHLDRIMERLQS